MRQVVSSGAKDVAETNLLLLAVAGSAAIMTTPAEQFWWLAPSMAGIAACLVIWFNWGQHKVRSFRMKRPFRLELVKRGETDVEMVNALHAPPDAELSIQLRIWPLLQYEHHEIIFGFQGDPARRPLPKKVLNEFIKIGKRREQTPDTNENHSIDEHDNYHIREDRRLSYPNNYTYGFVVQTREPGVYPILFEVITDCGEGIPKKGAFLTVDPREISE